MQVRAGDSHFFSTWDDPGWGGSRNKSTIGINSHKIHRMGLSHVSFGQPKLDDLVLNMFIAWGDDPLVGESCGLQRDPWLHWDMAQILLPQWGKHGTVGLIESLGCSRMQGIAIGGYCHWWVFPMQIDDPKKSHGGPRHESGTASQWTRLESQALRCFLQGEQLTINRHISGWGIIIEPDNGSINIIKHEKSVVVLVC
jgi:hypothetical protein